MDISDDLSDVPAVHLDGQRLGLEAIARAGPQGRGLILRIPRGCWRTRSRASAGHVRNHALERLFGDDRPGRRRRSATASLRHPTRTAGKPAGALRQVRQGCPCRRRSAPPRWPRWPGVIGRLARPTARAPPRRSRRLRSGWTTRSSKKSSTPSPSQAGQAPNGAVEREQPRLDLLDGETAETGQAKLGEGCARLPSWRGSVQHRRPSASPSAVSTDSARRSRCPPSRQAVHHDVDVVLDLLVQRWGLVDLVEWCRPPCTRWKPACCRSAIPCGTRPCGRARSAPAGYNRVPSPMARTASTMS